MPARPPAARLPTCWSVSPKPAGVVAVDADENRLKRVQENLDRIGLTAKVIHGDAAAPEQWWPEGQFDRILLDAPCSATGVIRRHQTSSGCAVIRTSASWPSCSAVF